MLGWAAEHLPGCDWDPAAPPGGWADACANRAAHAGQDAPRGTLFAAYYTLLDREKLFCRPPSIGDSEGGEDEPPPS